MNLDHTFLALADPVRRAVIARLGAGSTSVSDLAADHDISLPAFLKHLRVMERAAIVKSTKTGRVRMCELNVGALDQAEEWMREQRRFWNGQLDSLERFLANDNLEKQWENKTSNSADSSRPRRSASSKRGRGRKR